MRTTKKIISAVLAVCMLASTGIVSSFAANTESDSVSAYVAGNNTYSNASEAIDSEYTYTKRDLGATYTPEKTTFKVWSPTATEITLNLYATGSDNEEGAANLGTYALHKLMDGEKWTGVWEVVVNGDLNNVYYTYTVTANDVSGKKTTTKETQDVYSVATGVNGDRAMVCDLDSTDPEGWENDKHVLLDKSTSSSVWELHVKDFSYDPASGVSEANRGKYLAFTEEGTTLNGEGEIATCIDYLKELGITTVQLNPFYDYQTVNEAGADTQFNWGYDPVNYYVPEGSFSSNPYDGNVRIKECKEMIMALHNAGIQVVMDVVYNHTYSQDSVFQKTVPDYYYRFTSTGAWSNGSGCGNETATERAMFRNYVVQSCKYWAEEYHIDGFRFDLMGCMDVETMNAIRAELDKIDTRLLTYVEGWSGGTCTFDATTCEGTKTYAGTQANIQKMDTRIALFNDKIRDGVKGSVFEATGQGFVQGNKVNAKDISYGIRANTVGNNGWKPAAPSQCVTYASAHDNATLFDRLVNSTGKGVAPDYTKRYADLIEMNKLAAAIVYTSQGINFILAGEEMARTKLGDENSYSSPATLNMLNWENLNTYGDLVSYYKGLIQIRKVFAPFTADTNDFSGGYTLNSGLTTTTGTIAYTVANPTEGEWAKMAVIYNTEDTVKKVTLKDTSVTEWVIIANDKEAGLNNLGEVSGYTFDVAPKSALIAVDKASFDTTEVTDTTGTVRVKAVYETGDVLSERVLKGTVGTSYVATEDAGIDIKYVLDRVEGEVNGKFAEDEHAVTNYYKDYVPESYLNADVNGDGTVNIKDATDLQMHIAKLAVLSEEMLANADVNCDGDVNIKDATALQMYVAKFPVSLGTVEVNYIDNETGKPITPSITLTGRVGTPYDTDPKSVMAYNLDEEKLPENASGVYTFGETTVVNYYYNYGGSKMTVHIRYSEDTATEYALNIWPWMEKVPQADGSTLASLNLAQSGAWPGDVVDATKDAEGWMTHTLDTPGAGDFCMILSVAGNPQTQDYKGLPGSELWVIINGPKMAHQGEWLDIYTVDPIKYPDAKPVA